jgi:hypothetical protein
VSEFDRRLVKGTASGLPSSSSFPMVEATVEYGEAEVEVAYRWNWRSWSGPAAEQARHSGKLVETRDTGTRAVRRVCHVNK